MDVDLFLRPRHHCNSGDSELTIICVRDGVMAADSIVVCDHTIVGTATKIFKTKSGALIGATGRVDICERFYAWAMGFDFARWPAPVFPDAASDGKGFTGIVVQADGAVIEYGSEGLPITSIRDDFRAIGGPTDIAMGAMAAGASAVEAVEICCKRAVGIGGEITVLRLDDPAKAYSEEARKILMAEYGRASSPTDVFRLPQNILRDPHAGLSAGAPAPVAA